MSILARGGPKPEHNPVVDRCVCRDVPFDHLARLREQGLSFDEVCARTGCCGGCGLCEPYVRTVMGTGATSLPVLSSRDMARINAEARRLNAERSAGQLSASVTAASSLDERGQR